ncbi:MAG: RNA-binding protein [Opitutales bacterium]
MDIYVGNLPYETEDNELADVFAEFGSVTKATIIMDRETGRSKGFGFVTMPDDGEAENAIENLNGADFGGRPLKVNAAREREFKPRKSFGDRPPRRDFGDRPPRRDFGDRPPRRDGPGGPPRRDFGDRPPPRDFGEGDISRPRQQGPKRGQTGRDRRSPMRRDDD